MIYFTSDIHFSDDETMIHDDRPFKNIKKYDRYTLRLWNKIMGKDDTLYVIGDLLDCNSPKSVVWKKSLPYFKKIKAKIILIMGNNEYRIMEHYFDNNFEKFKKFLINLGISDVKKEEHLSFGGLDFYLTHKPVDYKNGYINLVGHLHRSRGQWYSFGLNVSCDLNHFRPYSQKDILFQLQEKAKYYPTDDNFQLI